MTVFTVLEIRSPGSVLNYAICRLVEGEWVESFRWFWSEAPTWVVERLNTEWSM